MKSAFGYSSTQIEALGRRLINHLREKIENTDGRGNWSKMMFDSLRCFHFDDPGTLCYPSGEGEDKKPEFLFDFVAYVQKKGILIAAESEWINRNMSELEHDFEKLLYVRSPLKLMICRINHNLSGKTISDRLFGYMRECCAEFSPGELFIIYCVKWKDDQNILRSDEAYTLQVPGEPMHVELDETGFLAVD